MATRKNKSKNQVALDKEKVVIARKKNHQPRPQGLGNKGETLK